MTKQDEKKYLKIGGIVAGTLLLGYLLFKKPNDNGGGEIDPTGNGGGSSSDGSNVVVFNASLIADNLYQLMDSFGTKEDEIIAELTNVTQHQFGQVIQKFGKKPYYLFGSNDWFGTPQNLKYWLQEELGVTSSYYRTLKLKYPQYL